MIKRKAAGQTPAAKTMRITPGAAHSTHLPFFVFHTSIAQPGGDCKTRQKKFGVLPRKMRGKTPVFVKSRRAFQRSMALWFTT